MKPKKDTFLNGYKHNFETLQRAHKAGRLVMVKCEEMSTGKSVAVICAMSDTPDGQFDIVPLARMFDGNPYEELIPPV
jgi:hypothetical protein